MRSLTLAQARRIAIAAQGLAESRPTGRVDLRHVQRVFGQVGMVQIDSVNVLARAHELALYSRLGPYPVELLDRLAYQRRDVFEYWGHAASFISVGYHPHLRHRMRRHAQRPLHGMLDDAPAGFLDAVEAEFAERGPMRASDLTEAGERSGPWWGWSSGKAACEELFAQGRLAVARRHNFARVYDLPDRVLPPEVLGAPTPSAEEADRGLLMMAAKACGVGTTDDLADYPRMPRSRAQSLLDKLTADGELERVAVEGWTEPTYLHPGARLPRRVDATALLSPFDSLVWHRPRAERLFGFAYKIEIYVPAPKRVYGYYVLPLLVGDRLVGRVDLKADRGGNAQRRPSLMVRSAWVEPDADPVAVAAALASELETMAEWLEAVTVDIGVGGNLASHLRAAATV